MALKDLKRFIRIEDEVQTCTNNELIGKQKASAHVVSSRLEFKKKSFRRQNKDQNKKLNNLNVKNDFKKIDNCFNCGKVGHFVKDCRAPKKVQNVNQVAQVQNFMTMISITKHTSDDGRWLDAGATCHVCANKSLFSTCIPSKKMVAMADHSTAAVLGFGTVVLPLTSEKTLTLKM